jgi:hypothetical protein
LAYVLDNTAPLPAAQLTELLFIAGCHKHPTTAQAMRQRGAQWPAVLRRKEGHKMHYWNAAVVAWARSQGCTSLDGKEPHLRQQQQQRHQQRQQQHQEQLRELARTTRMMRQQQQQQQQQR